jgi:TRAP-type C4-dicarboxylate transport system substrate-binding protein
VRTIADLNGMKIRVPASQMFADCFKSLGAEPVSINTNRLYDALKSGMVEGQENPLAIVDGFKLYEVQHYVSLTSHMWSGYNLLANLAMWRKLPADVRDAIERNTVKYVKLQRVDNIALKIREVAAAQRSAACLHHHRHSAVSVPCSRISTGAGRSISAKAWAMLETHVGKLG